MATVPQGSFTMKLTFNTVLKTAFVFGLALSASLVLPGQSQAQPFLDNNRDWATSSLNTNVNSRSSDHFRVMWGNVGSDFNQVSEQLAQGNLQMLEMEWHVLHDPIASGGLGIHAPIESLNPAYQDGNFYRTTLGMNQTGIWGGGAWGSCDGWGFPIFGLPPSYLRFDPPSGATPHEYGHTVLINAGGFNNTPYDGMWHEAFANWQELQLDNDYPGVGNTVYAHAGSLPHGRDYYDAWPIFEYLKDNPKWGSSFINTLITQAHGDQSKYSPPEYMFDAMARLNTSGAIDKVNDIKDALGDCMAHCLTWDFQRGQFFKQQAPLTSDFFNDYYRRGFTELEKRPGSTASGNQSAWYRVPWSDAPSQGGFDFIPIALNGKVAGTGGYLVGVNFQPLWDGTRGSDWRATLIAVNDNGQPRYSQMWNGGINYITLSGNENKLYLVVAATPRFMGFEGFSTPRVQDLILQPQAYEVAFVNTSAGAYESNPAATQSHTGMTQHSNGGGWKANTATVDATAYVGPNALVLGTAQVLGNARIEDYAVVRDSAQVRDNAIVSGHALVRNSAQVYGNARVRDWGTVLNSTQLYGDGKVLEHAYADNDQIRDSAVLKGWTYDYVDGGQTIQGVYGYGIKEGDCANGSTLSKGVLTCWRWGFDQAYADSRPDNGWRYCEYNFETNSPIYAKDTYGIIHGVLMGGTARPTTVASGNTSRGQVLALNGVDQYVELHKDVCDFRDCTISSWVKWNGGASQVIWSMGDGANKYMTLTAGTSQLRFAITATGLAGETAVTTSPLTAGAWTHLAVTFASGTITLYVNGTVAGSTTSTLQPFNLMGPNTVNGGNCNYLGRGNSGSYFGGQIDLFAVFMRALNATEVGTLAADTGSPVAIPAQTDVAAPTPNAPTWLQTPTALDESTIQMSATVGTDDSGSVEYYFTCTAGGGHNSGWISSNRYTDCGLTPGASYSYTIMMRDRWGNTTAPSGVATVSTTADSGAPTPNPATFAYGPIGASSTSITMTATRGTCSGGLVEYRFVQDGTTASGWQSSPTYTFTGLAAGSTHTYTVQMRNTRGVAGTVSAPSAQVTATDNTPPTTYTLGEWTMRPYATIDNCVSMTARAISDTGGVQYSFECTSGGGPNSGWIDSNTYKTPALADGSYTYRFRARQKDTTANVTGYSQASTATINPTTGYHSTTLASLATLQDHYLASFTGTVTRVAADYYVVSDLTNNASIQVRPNALNCATDLGLAFKTVRVNGHLFNYTNYGFRLVTYATLTTVGAPPYAISGRVTNTAGFGVAGATVYFSTTPNAPANPAAQATTDASGYYSMPIVNGSWYACAAASNYLNSAEQVVVMNSANVTNVNFSLSAKPRVSGTVTDLAGNPIAGARLWLSLTPNAGANPQYTTTTDASGNYSQVVDSATYYVAAGANGYLASADRVVGVTGNVTNIDFALGRVAARVIPRQDVLWFAALTDPLPTSGSLANWPAYQPAGVNFPATGSPTAQTFGGSKWVKNNRMTTQDGFRVFDYSGNPVIPCNGVTIVATAQPVYCNPGGEPRGEIVDIMYDRLALAVSHPDGRLIVAENGNWGMYGPALADSTPVVLSLVVQPDGSYICYTNGVQAMSGGANGNFATSMVPTGTEAFKRYVNIGRNQPDGWSAYNGFIGDVLVYTNALSAADRQLLEADLIVRSSTNAVRSILASATTGGSIVPDGLVSLASGTDQTFTLTASNNFYLADLVVDGVSQGPVSSYTFPAISTNHTIAASFAPITHTITASAGANGTISPLGAVSVGQGTSQTFTFTPNPGYMVDTITVDGVSAGRANSYTFNNVQGPHTIAVTFKVLVAYTITATAGSGGAISPAGAVQVLQGWNQTFTVTPNTKYAISNLVVDGVNLGKLTSYTFNNVQASHTISAVFVYTGRDIPRPGDLLFSVVTESLPTSGPTGPWPSYIPAGSSLVALGSPAPTSVTVAGRTWETNVYANGNGYRFPTVYSSPIPCSGVTVVATVKPNYLSVGGEPRGEVVDFFYSDLFLAVAHNTGEVIVDYRGYHQVFTGYVIPNGQTTVLSLVVQPNGVMTLFANGVQKWTQATGVDYTSLQQSGLSGGAKTICIGRNDYDGWSTFSGNIGDVFIYTTALGDLERQQLEADLTGKFINWTITASAGSGGTISPAGPVSVSPGSDQTFAIAPLSGYSISSVLVDGVAKGAVSSYTFTNVVANHAISATFISLAPAVLTIGRNTAGNLEITWPDAYGTQLQKSPALGAAANWQAVTGADGVLTHVGSSYKFTVTPGAAALFYGLGR